MKNILDVAVSYYEHINTKLPMRANLYDLLTTTRYKYRVMAVRAEQDAVRKKKLKDRLPAFTPSGLFRGADGGSLVKLTGLICIDIDWKDNQNVDDYDNLKERLGELPYVAFCGRSVGGEGYYAIIPIAQPDKFLRHFRSLQAEFAAIGVTIDPSCCDIPRKRFVSYDPEPYINQEAEMYEGMTDKLYSTVANTATLSVVPGDNSEVLNEVLKYIRIIEEREIDITTGWWRWFRIGCAFGHTFGETGRDMFHRVSQFYSGYNPPETDKLFDGILKGNSTKPIGIGTFFYYTRKAGLEAIADFWDEE